MNKTIIIKAIFIISVLLETIYSDSGYSAIIKLRCVEITCPCNRIRNMRLFYNDSLIQKFPDWHNGRDIKLSNLKEGIYNIEYQSFYGNIVRKSFVVNKQKRQKVVIYSDYINYDLEKDSGILDIIENNEEYKIIRYKFHYSLHSSDTILIKMIRGSLFAYYQSYSTYINAENANYIKNIEKELKLVNNLPINYSKRLYKLEFRGKSYDFIDQTGCWDGFEKLRFTLFRKII